MTKHKVHQGERLSTIAARYGVSHQAVLAANPGRETTVLPSGETVFRSLSAGDELDLPGAPGDLAGYRDPTGNIFLHKADEGCQGWQIKTTSVGTLWDTTYCANVASAGEFAFYDPDQIGQCPKTMKAIKNGGVNGVLYIVCAGMSNAAEPINPECPSYLVCPSKASPTTSQPAPAPTTPRPSPTTPPPAPAAQNKSSSWMPWVGFVGTCAVAAAFVGIVVGTRKT